MSTKHTPGELTINNLSTTGVEGPTGRHICSTGGYARSDGEDHLYENEANARRIVRAWNCHDDLLEALEELYAIVKGNGLMHTQKAPRAIAKAEGES